MVITPEYVPPQTHINSTQGGETQSDLSSEVSDSNENEPDEIDAQLSAKYTDLHANASEDPQCSPIRQPLAEVLHKWWCTQMSKDEIKKLLQETARPSNCDGVKNVLINKTVYKIMSKPDRDKDRPLKHITNALV